MTTDNVQPRPWEQPGKGKGGGPWKKGMRSPNPNGRPKGIIDRRLKMRKELMRDAPEVLQVVIDAAKGGDVQAANILLQRVLPTVKSESERVQFDFDSTAPLTAQVESVLQAIADGKVSVDVGKQIIDAISSLGAIKQYDELEARIRELEERLAS